MISDFILQYIRLGTFMITALSGIITTIAIAWQFFSFALIAEYSMNFKLAGAFAVLTFLLGVWCFIIHGIVEGWES